MYTGKNMMLKDEGEIINYYRLEQKVLQYGRAFFKEICCCNRKLVSDRILPLICYNELEDVMTAMESESGTYSGACFWCGGDRQAIIRIGIKGYGNGILTAKLKRSIRHEIIHYYLWLTEQPYEDNSLEFWCMCYAFDGAAYFRLNNEDQRRYDEFKMLYDELNVGNIAPCMRYSLIDTMVLYISEYSGGEYRNRIIKTLEGLKEVFHME